MAIDTGPPLGTGHFLTFVLTAEEQKNFPTPHHLNDARTEIDRAGAQATQRKGRRNKPPQSLPAR